MTSIDQQLLFKGCVVVVAVAVVGKGVYLHTKVGASHFVLCGLFQNLTPNTQQVPPEMWRLVGEQGS